MIISHSIKLKPLYTTPDSYEIDSIFVSLDSDECVDLSSIDLTAVETSIIVGVRCYTLLMVNATASGLLSQEQSKAKRDFYIKYAKIMLKDYLWKYLQVS